jgi:hypothetical protein
MVTLYEVLLKKNLMKRCSFQFILLSLVNLARDSQ